MRVTRLPSLQVLEKELRRRRAVSVSLAWALSPSERWSCSCRAAEARLLSSSPSFSLGQGRTFSARSLERLLEGQAKVRAAAFWPPLAVPPCAASGASSCGTEGWREGGCRGATQGAERLGEPPGTPARPGCWRWEETRRAGQRARESGGSRLCRARAAGAGGQLAGGPFCCGAAL